MQVSLLTPAGLAVALVAIVPLVALAFSELRARRVRVTLGLASPRRTLTILLGAAFVAAGVLVGAAAAQPVLERGATRHERIDVSGYVIVDTTRSMLAAPSPRSANRIARARLIATELREAVPELKLGVASLTDRVLPHVFPTLAADVYAATLQHSVGIERPPPSRRRVNATDLNALQQLGPKGFFPATPERRIVVVISDFETDPFSATGSARPCAGSGSSRSSSTSGARGSGSSARKPTRATGPTRAASRPRPISPPRRTAASSPRTRSSRRLARSATCSARAHAGRSGTRARAPSWRRGSPSQRCYPSASSSGEETSASGYSRYN